MTSHPETFRRMELLIAGPTRYSTTGVIYPLDASTKASFSSMERTDWFYIDPKIVRILEYFPEEMAISTKVAMYRSLRLKKISGLKRQANRCRGSSRDW